MQKPELFNLNHIAKITEANVAMLSTMHGALSEIAGCEVSLDGGIAQKAIAENALVAVYKIAKNLEVKDA